MAPSPSIERTSEYTSLGERSLTLVSLRVTFSSFTPEASTSESPQERSHRPQWSEHTSLEASRIRVGAHS